MKRIVFCGGGTGGHVTPAVAIVEEFQRRGVPVDPYLMGSGRHGERAAVEGSGIHHLDVYQTRRSWTGHALALRAARAGLQRLQPELAIGVGGYASIAGALAARSLGIPCYLLEQNAVPGRATSFLSRFTGPVFAGLPVAPGATLEATLVGTPIRQAMSALASLHPSRTLHSQEILVLGGSQGSRIVSQAFVSAVVAMPERFKQIRISHQAPADDVDAARREYARAGVNADVQSYFGDVAGRLASGPIVVSRAGGTTLAELTSAAVPAILIPHAKAIRDHQTKNAKTAEELGGAILLAESEVDQLGAVLAHLIENPFDRVRLATRLRTLARPEAASVIVSELMRTEAGRIAA